jgi:hypothetical protein
MTGENPKSEIRNWLSAAALTLRASCGRLLAPLESKQIRKVGIYEMEEATRSAFFQLSINSNLFRISSFGFRICRLWEARA